MKPCTRCNGSGTEPDPVIDAAEALTTLIRVSAIEDGIKADLAVAAARYREAASKRIARSEALLDEILGRFGDTGHGASHQITQVPVADIQSWRERRQA